MPGGISFTRYALLCLAGCLLISALLFGASAVFFRQNTAPPVVQGRLDLSGWNFERDGAVRLSGDWSFYWNRLVPPAAFALPDPPRPSLYARVPASWNGLTVDGEPIPGEGYATYRIKLALPKLDKPLAIRIPTINTSYRLWMDSTLIASVGTVGPSAKESKPRYAPNLAFLHARGTEVDLVLQVANFSHYKGGVWQPLEIGPMDSLIRAQELAIGFDTLLIGSLLIMGLYHLGLFAVRTKEWPMLFFGLFCLMISLRMSLLGEIVLTKLFPDFDWALGINLEYTTAALGMPLFVLFFSGLFPQESSRSVNVVICMAGVWYAAVMAVLPTLIMTQLLILLVKSVTGRLLLDTSKHGCPFRLEGQEGDWRITIQNVGQQPAEEIRSLLAELNLFYFEDYGSEADRRKWWLYDSDCPGHSYDAAGKILELKVDRRVGYTNEHAGKV